ncbi:inosine/xanthosine triphosphatase [Candidatus Woesebacteria bacterium]|nr:inosine/xanthosine triphosphatase [Candidatus Woesebacteria bacterium]
MKVIVGSKNPVKVGSVEEAFKKNWPDSEVVGMDIDSGVSAQPMSEVETMNGARQRAIQALKSDSEANYGVGIEGGVTEVEGKMFECAWVAIADRASKEGLAGGLYFELPQKIANEISKGGELGPLMDQFTGKTNVKQGAGAIGIFTKGQLDRKTAYVQIVLSAMIKFVSPEWFG